MAKIASETFTKVSERTKQAEENIESADAAQRDADDLATTS